MGLIVHAQNKERDLFITFSYRVNKAPGSSRQCTKTCKERNKKRFIDKHSVENIFSHRGNKEYRVVAVPHLTINYLAHT